MPGTVLEIYQFHSKSPTGSEDESARAVGIFDSLSAALARPRLRGAFAA